MKAALLLIALGFGYKIFADATKEQGGLKALGRLIGITMMLVSFGIGLYKLAYCSAVAGFCPTKKAWTHAGGVCPMK